MPTLTTSSELVLSTTTSRRVITTVRQPLHVISFTDSTVIVQPDVPYKTRIKSYLYLSALNPVRLIINQTVNPLYDDNIITLDTSLFTWAGVGEVSITIEHIPFDPEGSGLYGVGLDGEGDYPDQTTVRLVTA